QPLPFLRNSRDFRTLSSYSNVIRAVVQKITLIHLWLATDDRTFGFPCPTLFAGSIPGIKRTLIRNRAGDVGVSVRKCRHNASALCKERGWQKAGRPEAGFGCDVAANVWRLRKS